MAETDNGVCIWKIINFSMLPYQNGENLKSPIFATDSNANIKWCFGLFPKGKSTEYKDYIGLCFYMVTGDRNLKFRCNITLVSTEPHGHISMTINYYDVPLGDGFGFPNFVRIEKICSSKNLYLPDDTLTLRCEINVVDETSAALNENNSFTSNLLRNCSVYHTGIQVQRKEAITWAVRNIKELIDKEEQRSMLVNSAEKTSASLKLSINFNKMLSESCIRISIKQISLSLENEETFAKCKISVISSKNEYEAFKESTHLFKKSLDDVWHFPPFIAADMLTQEKLLYADDTLYLLFEFAFSSKGDIYHSIINDLSYNFRKKRKIDDLGWYIEPIYGNRKFCDIALEAEGKTFPYYKAILCARSPVFTAMFETNMKEKDSNVIQITDIDAGTLERMLEFMHSDALQEDLSSEDACKLYKAADKYDVDSLKHRCSVLLISALSVENVCNILILADVHQDNFLMIGLKNFICSHRQEIINSPQWKSFVDSKLSANTLFQMLTGEHPGVGKKV